MRGGSRSIAGVYIPVSNLHPFERKNNTMTNKLTTLLAFSAAGMSLAAMPAFGSELTPLHVTVPFAFTAGKTAMPAGQYTVYENDSHVITIRGAKSAIMVLSTPGTESENEPNALGFERSGSGFALRMVRATGHASSILTPAVGEK